MPTTSRPGMGASMRMVRAASAMARSSARASMRDSLTRTSGRTSYWVTTGPRVGAHDLGRDLEAAQLLLDDPDVAGVVEAAAPPVASLWVVEQRQRRAATHTRGSGARARARRSAGPRGRVAARGRRPAAAAPTRGAARRGSAAGRVVASASAADQTVWLIGAGLGCGRRQRRAAAASRSAAVGARAARPVAARRRRGRRPPIGDRRDASSRVRGGAACHGRHASRSWRSRWPGRRRRHGLRTGGAASG